MLEADMANAVYKHICLTNAYKKAIREVPFLSRCIDLVLVTQQNELISIEFKINDWRHAIQQAKNHKLGTDKAYICLPSRIISSNLNDAIEKAGLGLLLYNASEQNVIEVIPPPNRKEKIVAFQEILINTLNLLDGQCSSTVL